FGNELEAGEVLPVAELERAEVAANELLDPRFFRAHRRGDEGLDSFGEVGHDGGDIRDVTAVILEKDSAGADDAGGEPQSGRLEHRGRPVDKEVGIHSRAEVPESPPLGEDG